MVMVKTDVPSVDISPDQPGQVLRRDLIGPKDGAINFSMRQFELIPGASTPEHSHDWEHEVLILEGHGTLLHQGDNRDFTAGDTVFIEPEELHQFKNTGREVLSFICVVPNSGHLAGLTKPEQDDIIAAGFNCDG